MLLAHAVRQRAALVAVGVADVHARPAVQRLRGEMLVDYDLREQRRSVNRELADQLKTQNMEKRERDVEARQVRWRARAASSSATRLFRHGLRCVSRQQNLACCTVAIPGRRWPA